MYNSLSDDDLIHSYFSAVQMKLEHEFINMLVAEIEKRKLAVAAAQPFSDEHDAHRGFVMSAYKNDSGDNL